MSEPVQATRVTMRQGAATDYIKWKYGMPLPPNMGNDFWMEVPDHGEVKITNMCHENLEHAIVTLGVSLPLAVSIISNLRAKIVDERIPKNYLSEESV